MIGKEVGILIPVIHPKIYQRMKIIGVEEGGIWVESQKLINEMLQALKVTAAPNTLVIFVPYHQIAFAITGADYPSFDEKALGL